MLSKASMNLSERSNAEIRKKTSGYFRSKKPCADLVKQLITYRGNKVALQASKVKQINCDKPFGAGLQKQRTRGSSTIISALRAQELSPLRVASSQRIIEQSIDRLYRGSRPVGVSVDSKKTPLYQLADVVSEKKINEIDKHMVIQAQEFGKLQIQELKYLGNLKFDLELNSDVVWGKEIYQADNRLGVYYALQDKLMAKSPLKGDIDFKAVGEEVQDCSRLFRDILRGIVCKGAEDEAILMEMLWKIIIKLIDKYLGQHERVISNMVEVNTSTVRSIKAEAGKELREAVADFEKKVKKLEMEIFKLTEKIQEIDKENSELVKEVIQKSKTLNKIADIDDQQDACVELKGLLGRLSAYITESECEQNKQVITLSHLSKIIKTADIMKKPIEKVSSSSQTKWHIVESVFPELDQPLVSAYPLFSWLPRRVTVAESLNATQLCQQALENCTGELSFYQELMLLILMNNKNKDSLIHCFQGIYQQLVVENTQISRFFKYLLTNSNKEHLKIEKIIFKLNTLFSNFCQEGQFTFSSLIDFLQVYLSEERNFSEAVLEHLSKSCNDKDYLSILTYRFRMSLDKFGKGLKAITNKESTNPLSFTEWAKTKLNWWVSDHELSIFCESHKNLAIPSIFAIDFPFPERLKDLKLDKESFLLSSLTILHERFQTSELKFNSFKEFDNFAEFKAALQVSLHETPEKRISHAYIELILDSPLDSIFDILQLEQVSLKISEPTKPRKHPAPKKLKK